MTDTLIKVGAIQRPTKTVELKALKGAKITLHEKLNVKETRAVNSEAKKYEDDQFMASLILLKHSIVSWNIADAEGNKLPIEVESFDFIEEDDFLELIAAARGMTKDEFLKQAKEQLAGKKKLNS